MRGEREHARGRVAWVAVMAWSCASGRTGREANDPSAASPGCEAGLYLVDGACLSPREVRAYCGGDAVGASCVLPRCSAGEGFDVRTASCLSERDVRDVVAASRPAPTNDLETSAPASFVHASCHDDRLLVAHDDHAACVVRSDICPRGVHPQPANGCPATPACPHGEVRDHARCVSVLAHGAVNVGAWARATLGPDGGTGDDRLCAPLAAAPWDFDVGPGGSLPLVLGIDLVFPNNDPTAVTATITPSPSAPLSSSGARAVQAAVDSLLIPLRALGGGAGVAVTDAASVSLHLTCPLRGGSSPRLDSPPASSGSSVPKLQSPPDDD